MHSASSRSRSTAAGPDQRRRSLLSALGASALLSAAPRSWAGAQLYEPMADAVRAALAARIADSTPPQRRFDDIGQRIEFIDWLNEMSSRLMRRKPDYRERIEFLRALDYEAVRAGLDRQLVLGLIQVESNFRKYAVSSAGARGYMQVMPFWSRVIGDGDPRKLFDMHTNLRYGCVILRHYLDIEKGDLFLALGRYNGSRGRDPYPNSVRAAWQGAWHYAARKLAPS